MTDKIEVEEAPELPPEVNKVNREIEETVNARLKTAYKVLVDAGHDDKKIEWGPSTIDHDVIYVTVDNVPVYRVVVAFDTDGTVQVVASWMFTNLESLGAN